MSGKPQDKNAGGGRRRPKLIVAENGHQKVLEIGQKITTLGRSHENTVEIDDISSSRLHCQIERKEGGYEIVDLKSRNGTVVNGVLVLRKELRPGDCIEIGKTQVFFEHISQEYADETIDLTTGYFLEPLEGLEEEDQLSMLKSEREIFLKLMEINRNLNSKVVLDDLLALVVDTVVEVTSAERGFFLLVSDDELEVRAARNMDGEAVKDAQLKSCKGIAEDAITSRKPIISDDAMNDRRLRDIEAVK
ncbi:MAG: FHA domain-containing protein, partial [Planctomycetota bacterium]